MAMAPQAGRVQLVELGFPPMLLPAVPLLPVPAVLIRGDAPARLAAASAAASSSSWLDELKEEVRGMPAMPTTEELLELELEPGPLKDPLGGR